MIEGDVLGAGEAGRIAGRDDAGMEAGGDIHDAGKDILHVRHPEIDGAGGEGEFGTDSVGQRRHFAKLGQGAMSGAADAVEADGAGPRSLRGRDQIRTTARLHDGSDQNRRMTMHREVDRLDTDSAKVGADTAALGQAVEAVHGDTGTNDAAPGKGQPAAQHLAGNVLPVAVGAGGSAVQRLEDLVIGAEREDVEFLPQCQALRRRHRLQGAVGPRQGTAEIVEEDHGDLAGQRFGRLGCVEDTKGFGGGDDLLRTEKGQVQVPVSRSLESQHYLATTSAVRRRPCRCPAQQIAGDDQMSIGSANTTGCFGGDPARTHVTIFTAGATQSEATERFLCVETVKGCLDAGFLHMLQHGTNRGVRGTGQDISLTGKVILGGHSLHLDWRNLLGGFQKLTT